MARPLPFVISMTETSTSQADALLLVLSEREFIGVGALLGLRARPSHGEDLQLVESYLDSDMIFNGTRRKILIAYVPDLPPQ